MTLPENIQKFRRSINISQEELAEKCEVSRQAVTKWETGDSTPSLEKLIQLADIFEISLDELVGRIEYNSYERLISLIQKIAADDVPQSEDSDINGVVSRYILFTRKMNMDATAALDGLLEIFCKWQTE